MRVLIAVLTALVARGSVTDAVAQKPELTEVDAWLVCDPKILEDVDPGLVKWKSKTEVN